MKNLLRAKVLAVVLTVLGIGVSSVASAGGPTDWGLMKHGSSTTNGGPTDWGLE